MSVSQSRPSTLAHHFSSLEQQFNTARVGMWVFLLTEIMFFGGAFLAYIVYRAAYPAAFSAASTHMNFVMGTINTLVLLCSSLTMAMAVWAAHTDQRDRVGKFLWATMGLGLVFILIKGYEWREHYLHGLVPYWNFPNGKERFSELYPEIELFFSLYFAMTGLHALHMIIGIGVLGVLTHWARQRRLGADWSSPPEVAGLYWHFVDIIWIFLYPLFYLIHA
ncbi:MAG: cytochrome c oxidase subunit 3 [Pirellulales bacterium]|jgi:cytochrome c oxidase subunit 3|nr:cytochrome c oxidase subunit 3 [Pirellulales bacterium]